MFGERVQQPNCYQLEVIWSEVLDCFQQCSDTHSKLFRKYGELLIFDETGAYVRLSLFANSWLMRLNQQHLEKVVTSAFRSAYHLGRWHPKHSVFKRLQLSDKFQVGIEIKEICDYSPQQLLAFQYHILDGLLPFSLSSLPLSKREMLPTTSAVYFVLEGDSVTNCRVLYVGQSSNLARRWKNHSLWKVFKPGEGNFRIA